MRRALPAVLPMLVACTTTTTLQIRGVGDPNDRREERPVDVRIYGLKDDRNFRSASVDQLWTDDKESLGKEMVGEQRTITLLLQAADQPPQKVFLGELPPNLRFVGLLALFPKNAPRLVVERKDLDKVVRVKSTGIELEK